MSVKIVVTGDNHLNFFSQKFGSKLEQRRATIGRAWRETVDFAIDHGVDLYLNVGDMFDQVTPRNPPRCRVVEAFVDLNEAGVKSFIIAGTHDSPATMIEGSSPHGILQEAGLATVFEDTTTFGHELIEVDGKKISVAGISTDKRLHPDMDPLKDLIIPAGGDFNIAMLHYSTERIAPPYWEEPQIRLSSLDANKHINLFVLGHIHQHIKEKVGDSLILYPGATERVDFGEAGKETGFCYLEIDGRKIDVEFIKTHSQPMSRETIHASRIPSENPTRFILDTVSKNGNPEELMQLVLEGELDFKEYMKIDFSRIYDEGRRLNFFFEYLDRMRPLAEDLSFEPSEGLHPRNELVAMARRYVDNADPEDRASWERAMELAISYYDRFWEA